jgi:hypothetical protein
MFKIQLVDFAGRETDAPTVGPYVLLSGIDIGSSLAHKDIEVSNVFLTHQRKELRQEGYTRISEPMDEGTLDPSGENNNGRVFLVQGMREVDWPTTPHV